VASFVTIDEELQYSKAEAANFPMQAMLL